MTRAEVLQADLALLKAALDNGVLIRGEIAYSVAAVCEWVEAQLKERALNATETQTDFRDRVKRAIECWARPPRNSRSGFRVLWSVVGQRFGLGSTSAWKLCVELGFDPNMRVAKP